MIMVSLARKLKGKTVLLEYPAHSCFCPEADDSAWQDKAICLDQYEEK